MVAKEIEGPDLLAGFGFHHDVCVVWASVFLAILAEEFIVPAEIDLEATSPARIFLL